MPDYPELSKITLPSGTTYALKDQGARDLIDALSNYTSFLGVTTTALTDGATTNPIVINGESVTAVSGNIVTYGSAEFIWNGSAWQAFGDLSGLGALAYKDTASGNFTPHGSISAPTITVTPTTSTVKNPTSVTVAKTLATAAPGGTAPANAIIYYSVSGEILSLYQIGYTTGDSITTENVSVMTGASASSSQPTFTGTAETVTVS